VASKTRKLKLLQKSVARMLGTNQTKLGHQNKQRGQKVELKTYTDSRNIHIQTRLLGDLSSYNIFFNSIVFVFLQTPEAYAYNDILFWLSVVYVCLN
jgi:hypothetical protein